MPTSFIHISNHAQVGGIETSVVDNGIGRGSRIAWFTTGSGLRFKVLIDRGLDIGDAFYNAHSLAWLSNRGFMSPQPLADRGIDWLTTWGGGLLTTCGLTHVGGPETDEYGERGVHGPFSNIPAEIESIIQPDIHTGNRTMSITGTIRQARVFGPHLILRRTISVELGTSVIEINDVVINAGNTSSPHMLLYHFNFGWPLVEPGTKILWTGKWAPRYNDGKNQMFNEQTDFKTCPEPLEAHSGSGEDVGIINIDADQQGISTCGLHNQRLNLAVSLQFKKQQLPWLTN
ncbi:MAG TPA: DUF4432 family protein, partial [Flavitalea sp.]|nr:DUF4432 family protein [Flavitalea sp.]